MHARENLAPHNRGPHIRGPRPARPGSRVFGRLNGPLLRLSGLLLLFAAPPATPQSAAAADEDRTLFESRIRPLLVGHCYECHSDQSGRARGGLKVDSANALRRGGDSGPAVVPGRPQQSLLYQVLLYTDEHAQMPPSGKLPATMIADVRRWIEQGAIDPRKTKINPDVSSAIDVEQGRQFWAYQPPKSVDPPSTDDWSRTRIDQFVAARRDGRVNCVDDADARTLVRRLYLVLTGLPPSPQDMQHWLGRLQPDATANLAAGLRNAEQDNDSSAGRNQAAVAELIDQLLAQPQFGERWGRHWMDVARFAESTGGDQNNVFLHAWRYRDWVIDAFNSDMPYDRFVRTQLAGDLLPISSDREWADNIIGTGFLAIGVKLVGEEDQQKYFADVVDEQIDTTTRAFLGTSVACARCHDHKFDPIPQTDYYALAGIFRATETHYGLLKAQARQATTLIDLTGLGLDAGTPALSREKYAELIAARDEARRTVDDAMRKIRGGENVFRGTLRRIRSDRDETEAALQAYQTSGQPRVFAMGTQDRAFPLPTRLLVRGEVDQPAQLVPAGLPQVLTPTGRHMLTSWKKDAAVRKEKGLLELGDARYQSVSGRLELAQWISSRRNPLTARVMVNRIWYWMFGRGLVRTVDDFGAGGAAPSHPRLLDDLAVRFMEHDWSVKWLIKEIALSRTWQLASAHNATAWEIDPDNVTLWRMNARRLEAEAIRDAMLSVSGRLQRERPQGTLLREAGEGNVGQNVFEPVIRGLDWDHRSVYLPRVRGVLPEVLELFDAPDAGLVAGARDASSSPLQSLYLMNHPWMQQQADALADRVSHLHGHEQIDQLYQLLFCRDPDPEERQAALALLHDPSLSQLGCDAALSACCQALLCTGEFRSID